MRKIVIILLAAVAMSFTGEEPILIRKEFYAIHYSMSSKTPMWTEYDFTRKNLSEAVSRSPNFRKDDAIPSDKQAGSGDYEAPYDRGHLTPDNDFCFSTDAERSTMVYTNVAPQYYKMNRGVWKSIESYVHDIGSDYDTVNVCTGVLFSGPLKIMGNGVRVPSHFWKAVRTKLLGCPLNTIAFICPNGETNQKMDKYVVSVDSLEKLTGLDIFGSDKFEDNTMLINPHPNR